MRKLATAAALALVCIGAAAGPAGAAPQKISWSPCFQKLGAFKCATVQVPLDYDNPNGTTISIALTRLPATDQAHRIGSLFLNPEGPGGSGVFEVVFGGPSLFTPEVRARAVLYLDTNCAQRAGRIVEHMSTANVARDLDVLRQAVGDSQLTYDGVSSGTLLGQTYANMFPGKVRAMIIDGVLDPIAWTTGSGDGSTVRSRRGCTATPARRRRCSSSSPSATQPGRTARSHRTAPPASTRSASS